jgi:hypothetical protein
VHGFTRATMSDRSSLASWQLKLGVKQNEIQ